MDARANDSNPTVCINEIREGMKGLSISSEIDVSRVVPLRNTCECYQAAPDQSEFAGGVAIAMADESRTCQCDADHQKRYFYNSRRHTNLLD